ncbi:hypothetical protein TNCV_2428251 [Trichonephila clavipes]|nr:hypothetical protein TNCV_2428251 [Trichonephila clavipes]
MAPHKLKKSAPIKYTTDEEDILLYDVEEDILLYDVEEDEFVSNTVPLNKDIIKRSGLRSLVVRQRTRGRGVMSSSPAMLKTRRVGRRCALKLSKLKCHDFGV